MSKVNFNDYTSYYDTGYDFSALLGGTTNSSGNLLSDYAAIKNGSYGKLMKAYYAKQEAESASQSGDTTQKLTLMRSSADSLKKSADALNDSSLWEKKKITKTDEETGEEVEVEDYDWDAITKAVKAFVEDYNSVVDEAGNSNTKNVLRNAAWMTSMTDKNSSMLAKIGITIGKGNKLELDEDALKKADISSLKTVFTGYNSFASKISQKADSISNAAARTKAVTYTSSGSYSDTLSKLVSSTVDERVGDKDTSSDASSKTTDK
ncbi:MAG: flagellar filament capping protein FliD [Bacillota bacterium]|nr:flagellar filament capping protein FliD [Bacillota bacterium]